MQFNEREIAKIVLALNGDINFHGISKQDETSARNIKKLGILIDDLIDQIANVYITVKGRQEYSAKEINKEIQEVYKILRFWAGNSKEE